MTTWYVVDTSYADVTLDRAKELRAKGVMAAAQCLWTGAEQPKTRVTNLRNYIAAGIVPMGYISLAAGASGKGHIDMGRQGVPDDLWAQLVLVAVDVELAGIPNKEIRGAVELLLALGKRRCIYTSYGHWTAHQGNDKSFGDCLLWNALWDGDPDMDFERLPYGGWSPPRVVGEQWSGGTMVTGSVLADRNTFVREVLMPEPERLTDTEIRGAIGAILTQLGKLGLESRRLTEDVRGTFRLIF